MLRLYLFRLGVIRQRVLSIYEGFLIFIYMVLDLSKLRVTELHLDVDAGNYEVTLPSSAGTTNIEVEANVVNMELNIPDGVAARIQADTGLGAFIVDTTRFPKQGDYYISDNFNT